MAAMQTRLGANPSIPMRVFMDEVDLIAGHALIWPRISGAVAQQGKPASQRSDPKRTRAIFADGTNPLMNDCRRVTRVEDFEFHAIESHQSLFGSQPEGAIARLPDGHHRVLGRAVVSMPNL